MFYLIESCTQVHAWYPVSILHITSKIQTDACVNQTFLGYNLSFDESALGTGQGMCVRASWTFAVPVLNVDPLNKYIV